ncbi:hypothetical protein A0U87_11815 [Sphingobium sp. MP9-4]|nr:hypothetical protein A0U87_11815 [Sphingobium sp. MP9-4]
MTTVEVSYASIGALYSDAALELICLSVEDEFRRAQGSELEAVREKVSFLLKICDVARADGPVRHAILARAYAMARKLALGLDFYGCSPEWAPLISFDSYAALVKDYVIGPAFEIERSFNSYWDEAASAEAKRSEIRKAVGSAEQQVTVLSIEEDRVENDARNLLKSLEGMDAQVNAALAFLMLKEAELTAAIRSKHDRCDLVGTLTAVATIVVGVASGGTALIGAVAAGNKLYQDYSAHDGSIDELWDNRKIIQDDLKEVGEKGERVIDSINKIQEGVARLTPEQRRLPQFKMERAQFDKVAADFTDIPEAAVYREAGYAYLKAVETRNQAIVDYNAMLVQLVEYQARVASAQIACDALASALSGKIDPAEPVVVAAMNRIYLDTLSMAAQMVHAEKKALAYHFGRPAIATVSALNMSLIAGEHMRVAVTQWAAAKNRYAARRRLETGQLSINLREIVDEETWRDFKANAILSFTIRRDHPRYAALLSSMPGLRITGMEILFAGAQIAEGQTQIPWTMLQMGSELIYAGNGTATAFSHRPVLFRGWTPIAGAGRLVDPDFSENDLYAGISPYASWLFTFVAHPTLGLNLEELESATLKMSGYLIDG